MRPAAAGTPPLPREHGAWGILLIPFATAVGVSGVFDLKVALLLASVLCFYMARTSYLRTVAALAKRGGLEGPRLTTAATAASRWLALLLAGSAACVAPLLFVWQLWWLIAFGAAAAPLAFRKTERGVAMQLVAVAGLTLTAPAAWYVATSQIDRRAWLLWLLNALYFAGDVFYVKMHVAAAMARRAPAPHPDPWSPLAPPAAGKPLPAGGERGPAIGSLLPLEGEGQDEGVGRRPRTLPARSRWRLGAATLGYYTALPAVLLALVSSGLVSFWVPLAYAPVVVRAVAGVWRLSPTLRIKRLGWTEVAYSVAFAVILIATLR